MSKIATPREITYYETADGHQPYKEWFESEGKLKQQRVDARLARVEAGNFGGYKGVGEGVKELKFKDGTRVYVGEDGPRIVVLLLGGDKRSQSQDIKKTKNYWNDFKLRKKK
jgi:putative addiction module killer protein